MKNLKSGDLLIWKKPKENSTIAQKIISFFTSSQWTHVAIVVKETNGIYILDCNYPKIEYKKLQYRNNIYHIPMNIQWTQDKENKLKSYIGQSYSISQAIISLFGKPPKDNSWHCVEVTKDFYKSIGIKIKSNYTPKSFINAVLKLTLLQPRKLDHE
jgi:hypothetical protein